MSSAAELRLRWVCDSAVGADWGIYRGDTEIGWFVSVLPEFGTDRAWYARTGTTPFKPDAEYRCATMREAAVWLLAQVGAEVQS